MSTFIHTLRSSLLLLVSLAFAASISTVRADTVAAAPSVAPSSARADGALPAAQFTRDQLIAVLTRAVASHFNFEGELQLELLRAWSAPAKAAALWELNVIEYPAIASSSMMFRCQLVGDAAPVLETTFVVRAQLWRDAWSTRQPLTVGGSFDVAQLEARRVDVLR